MPLAVGGGIRTIEHIKERLNAGADKCIINTQALKDPQFIREAAKRFGSQCVVVSIDVFRHPDGRYEVYGSMGKSPTGKSPGEWAKEVEKLGAGEIFLNSINEDGMGQGYDLELIRHVTAATSIPVIACGGVGRYEHFAPGILEGGASAVCAGNIFHFFELSYPHAKQAMIDSSIPVRPISLKSKWVCREPIYDLQERDRRIADRLERAKHHPDTPEFKFTPRPSQVHWCSHCVYPSVSAVALEFDSEGRCTGCRMSEVKRRIPTTEWSRRKELLVKILEKYRSKDGSNYDCIIPVSGGKDSYFQTHVIKNELGLNPLLVTYNGNNYTEVGWHNVHRMKEVFGVDHIFYSPSVPLIKKLNRLGLIIMGDMNWHSHVGISTLPVRVAAQFQVPLIIWGEHGYLDLAGQFSMSDFPEMTYRQRLEHFARGYDWNYMVGLEGITEQDMYAYKYPSDQALFDLDLRGIYIGNYLYWEANEHGKMVVEKYGFKTSSEPFERTYRTMSNLDDMHENGIHDYLKYIKFGYGRCTDHACKDIRAGVMSRQDGIDRLRKMDPVKSKDLYRWLPYVGMTEEEFDSICDTFRDPRVWKRKDGNWVKKNIWETN
jgi:N-acetyl sugar amidotransferase